MIKLIEENVNDYSYNMDIASEISKNCAAELTAIEGYQKLLSLLGDDDENDLDVINEIISDEKNHIEKLTKLMRKYDRIAANKDWIQ